MNALMSIIIIRIMTQLLLNSVQIWSVELLVSDKVFETIVPACEVCIRVSWSLKEGYVMFK